MAAGADRSAAWSWRCQTFGQGRYGCRRPILGRHPALARCERRVATVGGKLSCKIDKRGWGDGVRARVVHSRSGLLVEKIVKDDEKELAVSDIEVRAGDTIDFAVDALDDFENDNFIWDPVVTLRDKRGGKQSWQASDGFEEPREKPLGVWARYAQVLLQSHEFAFVD